MKKIKKIWQENKVLLVLAIILIVCLIVVVIVGLSFFYESNTDPYGTRLDITKQVPLTKDNLSEVESKIKAIEVIKDSKVKLIGRVVYISIYFNEGIKMEDAKQTAESFIEFFNDELLEVYDIEITINTPSSDGFTGYTIMGAYNASGSKQVVWNNYNLEETSAE